MFRRRRLRRRVPANPAGLQRKRQVGRPRATRVGTGPRGGRGQGRVSTRRPGRSGAGAVDPGRGASARVRPRTPARRRRRPGAAPSGRAGTGGADAAPRPAGGGPGGPERRGTRGQCRRRVHPAPCSRGPGAGRPCFFRGRVFPAGCLRRLGRPWDARSVVHRHRRRRDNRGDAVRSHSGAACRRGTGIGGGGRRRDVGPPTPYSR